MATYHINGREICVPDNPAYLRDDFDKGNSV